MSNYQGRKPDFTPAVYTRYFERSETSKTTNGHIHFDEDHEEKASKYQIKRDLIFKRLFPSKYAQSNDDQSESIPNPSNTIANSSSLPAQSLGDFIPLSNTKKQSSPETDQIISSSDETDEDLSIEAQLPTIAHESIIGHLHPRSTIENVRAILIRELYQRTSDSNTEWLKCKMELPREYINPKYYADFQRRYRREIHKNDIQNRKSSSRKNKIDNGYSASNSTKQIDVKLENDDIIEISSTSVVKGNSSSSPIILSNSTSTDSKSSPEFVVCDTDEDADNHFDNDKNSSYFIDRSSTSFTAISQPTVEKSTEDYHQEDSKYAQLPSRTSSSSTIIRPIISKHQRRKQNQPKTSTKPLVSAIDRIIDHMDQSKTLNDSNTMEEQNLLIKQIKKRKKKKKQKKSVATE